VWHFATLTVKPLGCRRADRLPGVVFFGERNSEESLLIGGILWITSEFERASTGPKCRASGFGTMDRLLRSLS
jgi:hypothetical protein